VTERRTCAAAQALMRAWRLPELLIRMADDRHADQPNAKVREAGAAPGPPHRQGWDDPGDRARTSARLPSLLNLRAAAALQLVQAI
jgi:hypothetical protein